MSSRGFLVCADITGYTRYLSHSELEHASGILGDLLRLLLDEVKSPLHLSRVEGDAVISYAPLGGPLDAQLVVDRIEDTYVAFRRALEQMIVNTTCTCQACANIADLDLKFVVHHGEFAVQHLGAQDELVGPEVNFMFRLTKNRIREALGLPGYIAFTPEAVAALGLEGFTSTLVAHTESDPERGVVRLAVRDMGPVWSSGRDRGAIVIPPSEVVAARDRLVLAPQEEVFALLARPETRAAFFAAEGMAVVPTAEGRIGPGAVYVCDHGKSEVRQTVIDWAPPHRYAFTNPIPGGLTMIGTIRLEPEGSAATRVFLACGVGRGLRAAVLRPVIRRGLNKWADEAFDALDALVAAT